MPANVACPKCNAKYKLPENLVGRPVKCKKCGAGFKVGGNKSAALDERSKTGRSEDKAKQAATAKKRVDKELAKFGLDGQIEPLGGLFDENPDTSSPNPLSNIADPGFGSGSNISADEAPADDDLSKMFENPALVKPKSRKKSNLDDEAKSLETFNLKTAIKEVWFCVLLFLGPIVLAGVLLPYFMGATWEWITEYTRYAVAAVAVGIHIWGSIMAYKHSAKIWVLVVALLVPPFLWFYLIRNWQEMKPYGLALITVIVLPLIYIPFALMSDSF